MAYNGGYAFLKKDCEICKMNVSRPLYLQFICPFHPPSNIQYYPPTPYSRQMFFYAGENVPSPGPSRTINKSYISFAQWFDYSSSENLPPGAIKGGVDPDGQKIYVGRSYHNGDWLPANVLPKKRVCYLSYNGKEYSKLAYQVLSDISAKWFPCHKGRIPLDAIEGGMTSCGDKLYIGRVRHLNAHLIGKIYPSYGPCYIPLDGKEISYSDYEVLVAGRHTKPISCIGVRRQMRFATST